MNQPHYYTAALLLHLVSACHAVIWKAVPPQVSQTAIANDGSDVAVVMQNYEINQAAETNPGDILATSRNFEHQIFVQTHDGSQRRAITKKRPYKDELGTFHYLKTAGYILLGSMLSNRKSTIKYEKIDLTTGQANLIRNHSDISQPLLCKGMSPQSFVVENVLPSPDGTLIAYFYSPTCFKVVVEFLEAKTLMLLDTQHIEIKGINEAIWPANENLIVYSTTETAGNNAWKLSPKTTPLPTSFIK
jgi:hypothetical protein